MFLLLAFVLFGVDWPMGARMDSLGARGYRVLVREGDPVYEGLAMAQLKTRSPVLGEVRVRAVSIEGRVRVTEILTRTAEGVLPRVLKAERRCKPSGDGRYTCRLAGRKYDMAVCRRSLLLSERSPKAAELARVACDIARRTRNDPSLLLPAPDPPGGPDGEDPAP